MRLRIATCLTLPEPDVDQPLLEEALARAGIDATLTAWDDPSVLWSEPVPTVLRSTWNYVHELPGFLAWARSAAAGAPLFNPLPVITWNAHKRYLVELAAEGLPVVPTVLVPRAGGVDVEGIVRERHWGGVVVKPAVSAASFQTRRFSLGELAEAQAFAEALALSRDVLVQPFVPSVEGYGERAVVVIDGEPTHAVRKAPRFVGDEEQVSEAVEVAADERALAERVLRRFGDPLLYARVDMARDEAGAPMLMELEVIEPSLFFKEAPSALDRFVGALTRRLAAS